MNKDRILLFGGGEFHTADNTSAIRTEGGTALVYILPEAEDRPERKLLLAEMPPGSVIPSLLYKDEEGVLWKYLIMSLDERVELSPEHDTDRAGSIEAFALRAGIPNVEKLGYEEAVAEIYRLHQVKDNAFIYQADKDSRVYYEKGLDEIRKALSDEGRRRNDNGPEYKDPFTDERVEKTDIAGFILHMLTMRDKAMFVVLSLACVLLLTLIILTVRSVFENLVPFSRHGELMRPCVLLFSFAAGMALFTVIRYIVSFRMSSDVKNRLQRSVYIRAFNMPHDVLGRIDSADLSKRVIGFGRLCAYLFSSACTGIVSALVLSVSAIAMILIFRLPAVTATAAALLLFSLLALISEKRRKLIGDLLDKKGRMASEWHQDLKGIEKIRLSGSENSLLYRYICGIIDVKNLERRAGDIRTLSEVIRMSAGPLIMIIIFCFTGTGMTELTFGDYITFGAFYGAFTAALSGAERSFLDIRAAGPQWERMRFLFENAPENTAGPIVPEKLTGKIDIDNVYYSYDEGEANVLDGISLHIAPGEYVGIVGPSGSGKSTLIKMLLGFITPDRGRIYYDSTDLAALDKQEVRRRMGVVLQNDDLIAGSLADNLSVIDPDMDTVKMAELLEKAGMKKETEKLPMGLDTVLDPENPAISGGQKQRLIIARALASDPSIILFDEATSSLDNISQSIVCSTLLDTEATRIVIAHRLSTVIKCDRIVVLDKGRIAEEGTYEELMKKNGLFAEMARRQIA